MGQHRIAGAWCTSRGINSSGDLDNLRGLGAARGLSGNVLQPLPPILLLCLLHLRLLSPHLHHFLLLSFTMRGVHRGTAASSSVRQMSSHPSSTASSLRSALALPTTTTTTQCTPDGAVSSQASVPLLVA
jgi:hypothetical protein